MNQRKVLERTYGKVKIKVYGGFNEVGGNCITIEDKDRKIVFDNGIRFPVIKRWYGGRIEPLGPSELRAIGAIPILETFQEASTLYISHFHLDHTGLLNLIPPEISIKVPSTSILEKTLASWYKTSQNWLAYVPPNYTSEIEEIESNKEDENNVIAIPVSHSSFPAYSFLYFGSEATIFYSGDLRIEPLTDITSQFGKTIENLSVDKVDVALIEGTNFSAEYTPITSSMFREYVSLLLREKELVSTSIDPLDLETFIAILELSLLMKRNLVIGSMRLLWMIDEIEKLKPGALDKIYISEELQVPTPISIKNVSLVNEVFNNTDNYVLLIEPVGLLEIFRKLKIWNENLNLAGSFVILTDPEPRESIKEVEEIALRTWLRSFGIQTLRLRLSGHYLPYQFNQIISTLKPKHLIPIHTEETELVTKLFQKFTREK
jgi:Predicted hydrolase of the metallo-beta-lactamase superfamily